MHVRTSDRRFQIPSDPDKEVDLEIEEEAVGTHHSAERCLANKFDLRETIYRSFISSACTCHTVSHTYYHHFTSLFLREGVGRKYQVMCDFRSDKDANLEQSVRHVCI